MADNNKGLGIANTLAGFFEADANKKPQPQQVVVPAKPVDPEYGNKARKSIKDAFKIK